LIITNGNTRKEQVEAGILYSRFLLKATDMGYSMQPMSQALEEYPEMAEIYRKSIGNTQGKTKQSRCS
jgi:hypothetical protein